MPKTEPTKTNQARRQLAIAIAAVGLAGVATAGAFQPSQQGEPARRSYSARPLTGTTEPSLEADLAFASPGKVGEVNVEEGQRVKAGDVLMKQDDRAERARLAALEADADVSARVKLAEQKKELADIQLQRQEEMAAGLGGRQTELEEARINAAIAATEIVEEQRQGLVAQARVEEQKALVEDKTLTSPHDGVVQVVDAAVGEVTGPSTPAVRVLKIDPLHVKVLLEPVLRVEKLRPGQVIKVKYPNEETYQEAKVLYIEPRANRAAGDPLPFTLEMPNPDLRAAGLTIEVLMPEVAGDDVAAR